MKAMFLLKLFYNYLNSTCKEQGKDENFFSLLDVLDNQ
jgi:hypothetical protein